jgi:hypothetical protein
MSQHSIADRGTGFPFSRETCNIQVFHVNRRDFLGLVMIHQPVEAFVFDPDYAEGRVLMSAMLACFDTAGERPKNRTFPTSGESYNSQLQNACFLLE